MVDILHHDWSILTVYVDYFLLSFNLMYLFYILTIAFTPSSPPTSSLVFFLPSYRYSIEIYSYLPEHRRQCLFFC